MPAEFGGFLNRTTETFLKQSYIVWSYNMFESLDAFGKYIQPMQ